MASNGEAIRRWLSPIIHLSNNWISTAGIGFVTTATVLFLFLLPSTLEADVQHPYLGIASFLFLPAVFFLGLGLIPLGIWLRYRREKAREGTKFRLVPAQPGDVRRLVVFVLAMTGVNIVLGSVLTYRAVEYMDSVAFCGKACHTVMKPEYTAYQNSPHSRVGCVQCHIGPGASWFVRSKLSGLGQVFAVTFNTYPRPIPTPVENLRPARETCEACHWPQKFGADRLRIITSYADDETNTRTRTVLLMRIGGGGGRAEPSIHGAHLGPGVQISYWYTDDKRQVIPRVEYHNSLTGRTTLYATAGSTAGGTRRVMDCVDCHNRPTHTFEMPNAAVDRAMAAGLISPSLPFVKKEAVDLLQKTYSSDEQAAREIRAGLERFYREKYPQVFAKQAAEIRAAADATAAIWSRNVFPDMNVTWGVYPNNIGHMQYPGCFRCHDGEHTAANGQAITQDCNTCHVLLAQDEPSPKILEELGLAEPSPEK